jgi:hypothetical protein
MRECEWVAGRGDDDRMDRMGRRGPQLGDWRMGEGRWERVARVRFGRGCNERLESWQRASEVSTLLGLYLVCRCVGVYVCCISAGIPLLSSPLLASPPRAIDGNGNGNGYRWLNGVSHEAKLKIKDGRGRSDN